jgi:hypothetical protein
VHAVLLYLIENCIFFRSAWDCLRDLVVPGFVIGTLLQHLDSRSRGNICQKWREAAANPGYDPGSEGYKSDDRIVGALSSKTEQLFEASEMEATLGPARRCARRRVSRRVSRRPRNPEPGGDITVVRAVRRQVIGIKPVAARVVAAHVTALGVTVEVTPVREVNRGTGPANTCQGRKGIPFILISKLRAGSVTESLTLAMSTTAFLTNFVDSPLTNNLPVPSRCSCVITCRRLNEDDTSTNKEHRL